jgi:hypothetical protein
MMQMFIDGKQIGAARDVDLKGFVESCRVRIKRRQIYILWHHVATNATPKNTL